MRDRGAIDAARGASRIRRAELATRDREHGTPGVHVRARAGVPGGEHAAPGLEMIVPIGFERSAAPRVAGQVEAVAELLEQDALEGA